MITLIRITGQAGVRWDIDETFRRLNVHRKLACTLIDEKDTVAMGMVEKVRNDAAFGVVGDDLLKELIAKRGQTLDGKAISEKDVEKTLADIKKGEWKIKKFFRLHPPRGGFKKSTKLAYPKGVLGKNEALDKLLVRML